MKRLIIFLFVISLSSLFSEERFPTTEGEWYVEAYAHVDDYDGEERATRILLECIYMRIDKINQALGLNDAIFIKDGLTKTDRKFYASSDNRTKDREDDILAMADLIYARLKIIHNIISTEPIDRDSEVNKRIKKIKQKINIGNSWQNNSWNK